MAKRSACHLVVAIAAREVSGPKECCNCIKCTNTQNKTARASSAVSMRPLFLSVVSRSNKMSRTWAEEYTCILWCRYIPLPRSCTSCCCAKLQREKVEEYLLQCLHEQFYSFTVFVYLIQLLTSSESPVALTPPWLQP